MPAMGRSLRWQATDGGRVFIGYALHANPDENGIPCYRVVTKEGRVSEAFAFGGGNRQVELLKADGVGFVDGHVDWNGFSGRLRGLNEKAA